MDLVVPEWEQFRDPDQMTYATYVAQQDDQETYVEGLLEQFDSQDYDASLTDEALSLLRRALTPTRYVAHSQQMLSAYLQQLAVSSYVATCAAFQTADQLRRVQLTAYRTTQLKLTHPDRGFATGEKSTWTEDPEWQPIRSAFEWALVEFDWDRAFVATNLVVKPIADQVFLVHLASQLAAVDARLDELIIENLWQDAQRSLRWTSALVNYVSTTTNLAVLQRCLDSWSERALEMIDAGARVIETPSGASAAASAARIRTTWTGWLGEFGLSVATS
ncbi:ferritin family protein [Mycolicibacterium gadium]|uniref:toluene hydroxylase n=2 Tax=Mycobacteriaceae TaxID=1762 RepID=UPI002415F87F|nr:toluene hydroxylase [Mycolicibacterium gadium]